MPAQDPITHDVPFLPVQWILRLSRLAWKRPRGRPKASSGTVLSDTLVRTFHVVDMSKAIEEPLLFAQSGSAMKNNVGLQVTVHALMTPIVLRFAWPAEDRLNTERHQHHAHGREAALSRAKGRAVIALHRSRQSVVAKHALDHRPGVSKIGRWQSFTCKHVSADPVHQRQRVTRSAVSQSEVPLVVDGGELARIGCLVTRSGRSRALRSSLLGSQSNQSPSPQNVVDG